MQTAGGWAVRGNRMIQSPCSAKGFVRHTVLCAQMVSAQPHGGL